MKCAEFNIANIFEVTKAVIMQAKRAPAEASAHIYLIPCFSS